MKADGMGPSGDLDAGRRELAGGDAVHQDFGAGWRGIHLGPGDVSSPGLKFEVKGGQNVVLHLDLTGVRFVTLEAKNEIVGTRGEGKIDGGLTGLLVAVDEDVCPGWTRSDKETLCERFEHYLLILGIAGLEFKGGLNLQVALFLHLQTVAARGEVVEAAGSLACAIRTAGGAEDGGFRTDHIRQYMNGCVAVQRN